MAPSNPRLRRTRSAPLRSPLSGQPLGDSSTRRRVDSQFRKSGLPIVILPVYFLLAGHVSQAQGVLGTGEGSNQAIVFPSPNAGLPIPVQMPIAGISGFNQPHGVAFFGPDDALVAGGNRIFVVKVSSAQVVSIIPTSPSYDGTGSLAVSPGGGFALASGGTNQVTVIKAPFGPASEIAAVPLPGGVPQQTTQAIVFSPAGRAFIYNGAGISVLDPPYSTVGFTIPVATLNPGALGITPDGTQLLARTDLSLSVAVLTAPFSPVSSATLIDMPARPGGIAVLPDGSKALVASDNSSRLFAISAPFTASSVVDEIPLAPAVFAPSADIGISTDGQLAVLTGQGGFTTPDIAFVRGPFTASGATVFDVRIPGGRGNGAFRFADLNAPTPLPTVTNTPTNTPTAPPLPPPVVPTLSFPMLALFAVALAGIGLLSSTRVRQ